MYMYTYINIFIFICTYDKMHLTSIIDFQSHPLLQCKRIPVHLCTRRCCKIRHLPALPPSQPPTELPSALSMSIQDTRQLELPGMPSMHPSFAGISCISGKEPLISAKK